MARGSRRGALATVVAAAAAMLAAAPAPAAPDPERSLTTPTGWQWWAGRSGPQLKVLEGKHMRVIDLEVERASPHRFSATMVRNSGAHERDGSWFSSRTSSGVDAATKKQGRRLIDIEVYRRSGQLRFAGVTVRNKGAAGKFWDWGHGLSAKKLGKRIKKLKLRLIDLEAYETTFGLRYAWVAVANHGEDATGWWWYLHQTAANVQKLAVKHGARILDLDQRGSRWNVILVPNKGIYARHVTRRRLGDLGRYAASHGVRITDVERRHDRFSAVMVDNVDEESARIRHLILQRVYKRGFFGAFSKRVGGRTYVGLAHRTPYQPMSVQKLIPHLYAIDRWDRGKASLSDTLTWRFPKGNPREPACPNHQGETFTSYATLRHTLKRALGESLNLAHEELLLEYGPATITNRVRAMGLDATRLYFGCKHPKQKTWLSNRSTLADMGWLFEGVDRRIFFPHREQAARDEFYALVADWGVGPLRDVVADEAAKQGKPSAVDAFMAGVRTDAKGGGADTGQEDGSWEVGRALSWRTVLPFRMPQRSGGSAIVHTPFVGGFFVNDLPAPCHEDAAREDLPAQTPECQSYVNAMGEAFNTVYAEVMRVPIREALQTWPPDPPPADPGRPEDESRLDDAQQPAPEPQPQPQPAPEPEERPRPG